MKCLLRYQWVKLPRTLLPAGKGLMGYWAKLAAKAAFRKGQARYCGHINEVNVGTWSGGIVGLKSILGIKNRRQALETMDNLSSLGYIEYALDAKTKKLTYKINDYVLQCSGEPCSPPSTVYTTDGYGFLCLPRNITQRIADVGRVFMEADAWLDLWCHTIWRDPRNIFSFSAPTIQYGKSAALTLETLGQRWGWEKTKVWRFLSKHQDAFALHKLPGSYGCLIFNIQYPGEDNHAPSPAEIKRILDEIRILDANTHLSGSENDKINRSIALCSQALSSELQTTEISEQTENRVAVSVYITRAYFSLQHSVKREYDCKGTDYRGPCVSGFQIRGP